MNGRTLYLHIGAHRTATTYVQQSLHLNVAWFARQGVDTLSDLAVWGQGHHNVALACLRWPLQGTDAASDHYLEALRRRLLESPHASLILSSEFFERCTDAAIQRLRPVLEGFRVIAVYCLRRQAEYLQSLYCEDIKHGVSESFRQWLLLSLHEGAGDFHAVTQRWMRGLELRDLRLIIYDNLLAGGLDPFQYLVREIFVPGGSVAPQRLAAPTVNVSIAAGQLWLLRQLNLRRGRREFHATGISAGYLRMRRRLERAFERRLPACAGTPAVLLDASTAAMIESWFDPSNRQLRDQFGDAICNRSAGEALFVPRSVTLPDRADDRAEPTQAELLDLLFEILHDDGP